MYGTRLAYPNIVDRIFDPCERTPTITASLLPDVAELDEDDQGQQREQEERDRRALPEVAAGEPDLVRESGEEVRGVDRAAARQHLNDVEVGEREDGREE